MVLLENDIGILYYGVDENLKLGIVWVYHKENGELWKP